MIKTKYNLSHINSNIYLLYFCNSIVFPLPKIYIYSSCIREQGVLEKYRRSFWTIRANVQIQEGIIKNKGYIFPAISVYRVRLLLSSKTGITTNVFLSK